MLELCELCNKKCNGKLRIATTKKGSPKIFCHDCFNHLINKSTLEVRKILHNKQNYLKSSK